MPTDIFMTVTDEDGNNLTDGASSRESIGAFRKENHEDEILVTSFTHDIGVPMDDRTGERTSNPRHRNLSIEKLIDKSSPLLWAALSTNSSLSVTLEFYRGADSGSSGEPVHYYTVELDEAKISEIQTISPDLMNPDNDPYMAHERISFTYNSIRWEHVICSTENEMTWST